MRTQHIHILRFIILFSAILAICPLASYAQLTAMGGTSGILGSTGCWDSPGDEFLTTHYNRYVRTPAITLAMAAGDTLLVGIAFSNTDPYMLELPFRVHFTGNPSSSPAPNGIETYAWLSPDYWGSPVAGLFPWDPVQTAIMNASPTNPFAGIGTWRMFKVPLTAAVAAGTYFNIFCNFGLRHASLYSGDLADAVLGYGSGLLVATAKAGAQNVPFTVFLPELKAEVSKMHFIQYPDTTGIDFDFTYPKIVADDWRCEASGPVDDIQFWFSAEGDWLVDMYWVYANIQNIQLTIYADIPDPDGAGPLSSQPGAVLWTSDSLNPPIYMIEEYALGDRGWFDPQSQLYTANDHTRLFSCRVWDFYNPFQQVLHTRYWLGISLTTDSTFHRVGWTSADMNRHGPAFSGENFRGTLAWGGLPTPAWQSQSAPAGPFVGQDLDLAFAINPRLVAGTIPVCYDGIWGAGEFCGRDAYVTTGVPDMNHDCVVDLLDAGILELQMNSNGLDMSGDLTGDGLVAIQDRVILNSAMGSTASPCISTATADQCGGSLALSFNSDPALIIDTAVQTPGQPNSVFVVADGWAGARFAEFSIETSTNILIMGRVGIPGFNYAGACSTSNQKTGGTFATDFIVPSTASIVTELQYFLTDASPAWLRIVPDGLCSSYMRWTTEDWNQTYHFADILNAGVNGPAPSQTPSSCPSTAAVKGTLPQSGHFLEACSPNPFNPSTRISFLLEEESPVNIAIFDLRGQRVRTLVDETMVAGTHATIWDGLDDQGTRVSSGVYFYRMKAGSYVMARKMALLK